jgi:hypothetical protein
VSCWPYATPDAALWSLTHDGDPRAYALASRHYNFHRYADGRRERPDYRNRRLFVGPGEKLVLLSRDAQALFVWRKFLSRDRQAGVNCALFRNEGAYCGAVKSSRLILAAEAWASARWPGERLYTYVDPHKVRSRNPGYCYLVAGWRRCGVTKVNGLLVLEKWPAV